MAGNGSVLDSFNVEAVTHLNSEKEHRAVTRVKKLKGSR